MMKTNKRNLILIFAVILFAACTALWVVMPKNAVKADTSLPVLSETEAAEKLYEPQDEQVLKGKYLLIADNVESLSFQWGLLDKYGNFFKFSWYVNDIAGEEVLYCEKVIYGENEYFYLYFFANTDVTAFMWQSINNEEKEVYVSDEQLLFEDYGKEPEEKPPFDLGEWVQNAGNDVSVWLGDNIGLSITGGTVIIIGAIIIFFAIRRRR